MFGTPHHGDDLYSNLRTGALTREAFDMAMAIARYDPREDCTAHVDAYKRHNAVLDALTVAYDACMQQQSRAARVEWVARVIEADLAAGGEAVAMALPGRCPVLEVAELERLRENAADGLRNFRIIWGNIVASNERAALLGEAMAETVAQQLSAAINAPAIATRGDFLR
ncbi:MAG: hypothetical protein KC503_43445, partial [Myxococcales bacterium]|nr:hypothetical protein [Myxococcales bacterium]